MNGIIAFFDILGYKSFLKNNDAETSAQKVLDIISGTPAELLDGYAELKNDKLQAMLKTQVKHLVFSDTIVLSLSWLPKAEEKIDRYTSIMYFEHILVHLFIKMFNAGLPVRGGISEGKFFIQDYCLAGDAVNLAHELCESIDCSGLVFGKELGASIITVNKQRHLTYYTPFKKNDTISEAPYLHCNWLFALKRSFPKQYALAVADPAMFVARAFWCHNKDMPLSTDRKFENTVKLVRRLIIQNEINEADERQLLKPEAKLPRTKKKPTPIKR